MDIFPSHLKMLVMFRSQATMHNEFTLCMFGDRFSCYSSNERENISVYISVSVDVLTHAFDIQYTQTASCLAAVSLLCLLADVSCKFVR